MLFGRVHDRTHYGLVVNSAPAVEPVSRADMQAHLRLDEQDDATYVDALITAARTLVENHLGRRLITQTWDFTRDAFPIGAREMMIPYGPVQSVTSITYIDSGGTTQTWDPVNYLVDTASVSCRIYPAYSLIWPLTRDIQQAVTVRYVTGYGAAGSNVPATIIHAIKLLAALWYENREEAIMERAMVDSLPVGVAALLSSERESWV